MSIWSWPFGAGAGVDVQQAPTMTPKQALERLCEGNKRYVQDKLVHPNRSQESREANVHSQHPFAIILGCADSRVSPEILFDQGIGDLFVVRVAGNVAGPIEVDSIDFCALNLGSAIILVLGHESCGAVTAVVRNQTNGIKRVAQLLKPGVLASRGQPGDPIKNAVEANIRQQVKDLKRSPVLGPLCKKGQLDVVGGYYHLTTGEVEILPIY